jgi:hypothetical protein
MSQITRESVRRKLREQAERGEDYRGSAALQTEDSKPAEKPGDEQPGDTGTKEETK